MKIAIFADKSNAFIKEKSLPKFIKQNVELIPSEFRTNTGDIRTSIYVSLYLILKNKDMFVDIFEFTDSLDITQQELDNYDFIFIFFEMIDLARCFEPKPDRKLCFDDYKKFANRLRKTKAKVFPDPDMSLYSMDKTINYNNLKNNGIPVAPLFTRKVSTIVNNFNRFFDELYKQNWDGVIFKPSYAYGSGRILVVRNINKKGSKQKIRKYINELYSEGFPNIVIQKFIPSFGYSFEFRTYWFQGKYKYTSGSLTPSLKSGTPSSQLITKTDTFKSEGGNIDDSVKQKLIKIGKKVIKVLPVKPKNTLFTRIDFGCCLESSQVFVNEVEVITAAGNYIGDKFVKDLAIGINNIVNY